MVLLLKPSPKEVQTLIKTDSFQSGIDSVLQEKKIGKLVVSSFPPQIWHICMFSEYFLGEERLLY